MWFLQSVHGQRYINGRGQLRENLTFFINSLEENGLFVTKRAAYDIERYCRENFTDGELDVIGDEAGAEIARLATQLRTTLNAESMGLFAHVITDKRYAADTLLYNPWSLLSPDVYGRIDDIAIRDIEEAAKCIAFERPTAAAFHLLRATESTLKKLYCATVTRNRSALMWGPMITSLRARRNPPDIAMLDHLDAIRRNFRNPTQHPEKVYDLTEAQDLFGVCIDVINRMSSLMPDR